MGSCSTLNVASADRTFPDSNGIPMSMQVPNVATATKVGAPQKTNVIMAEVYTYFLSQPASCFLSSTIFERNFISQP
ncbi:ABC transporter C family member 3-like [Iris pallida]|uniref:ABC transporter C family member 3-like n=1 Tax=Iris pallida TaxID=29817 RepID=A0AAX6HU92_IRIPA|nr:ABC transporter C family member 3-like [Iris pallida]